jgi:hypothetical protein
VIGKSIANILSTIELFNADHTEHLINITSLELLKLTTNQLNEIIYEVIKNLENEVK